MSPDERIDRLQRDHERECDRTRRRRPLYLLRKSLVKARDAHARATRWDRRHYWRGRVDALEVAIRQVERGMNQ